mmetsp:Transcript_15884/g.36251  ORF Transcript_15884/g.36251 Transcript_15884/m.36251 type:complete len:334 (+) Transcript_15884:11302-12303(+)
MRGGEARYREACCCSVVGLLVRGISGVAQEMRNSREVQIGTAIRATLRLHCVCRRRQAWAQHRLAFASRIGLAVNGPSRLASHFKNGRPRNQSIQRIPGIALILHVRLVALEEHVRHLVLGLGESLHWLRATVHWLALADTGESAIELATARLGRFGGSHPAQCVASVAGVPRQPAKPHLCGCGLGGGHDIGGERGGASVQSVGSVLQSLRDTTNLRGASIVVVTSGGINNVVTLCRTFALVSVHQISASSGAVANIITSGAIIDVATSLLAALSDVLLIARIAITSVIVIGVCPRVLGVNTLAVSATMVHQTIVDLAHRGWRRVLPRRQAAD